MIASSTLARPFGAAPSAAALRLCVDLPDRLNTFEAPSGRLHVASKATSRWRVAEAQHSEWVRGMSEPPYGRHVGMALPLGRPDMALNRRNLPDSRLPQRLHVV